MAKKKAEAKPAPPPGRPTTYTNETADKICERLADGESLRRICSGEDMPNKATVFRWLAANEIFRDQYARAREAQAEALADEIIDIADEGLNDSYTDKDGNVRTDHDVIARSRLRVDARKWVASKLKPKVYGDVGKADDNLPDQTLMQALGELIEKLPG
jgi:hypothetical protein